MRLWCAMMFTAFGLSGCGHPQGTTSDLTTIGRYVVVHSPHVESDTVLLDTATGRTWTLTELTYVNGEPVVWEPVKQMNTPADQTAVEAQYVKKPAAAVALTSHSAAQTSWPGQPAADHHPPVVVRGDVRSRQAEPVRAIQNTPSSTKR